MKYKDLKIIDSSLIDNEIEKYDRLIKEANKLSTAFVIYTVRRGLLIELKGKIIDATPILSNTFREGFDEGITAAFCDDKNDRELMYKHDLKEFLNTEVKQ